MAAAARVGRNKLRPVDRVPRTYDGQPITLHGTIDLGTSFEGNTMRISIKLDTAESGRRKGPGRPPKWVDRFLESGHTGTQLTTHEQEDPTSQRGGSTQEEEEDPTSERCGSTQEEEEDPTSERCGSTQRGGPCLREMRQHTRRGGPYLRERRQHTRGGGASRSRD